MVQIDFSKIRGDFAEGQRGAFEELVCQLARREAPSVESFRRIEGAGGDGGVECLVQSADGTVGYQAKFYTKAGQIDWTAIDKSVDTALKLHPDLVRYVIALPCDFTGRRQFPGTFPIAIATTGPARASTMDSLSPSPSAGSALRTALCLQEVARAPSAIDGAAFYAAPDPRAALEPRRGAGGGVVHVPGSVLR